MVIQYGASLSQMSAISNFTHSKLATVWIFNGSSPLSSFYTWRPPVCLSSTSLQYIVTRRSFCVLATPCSERSHGHKEEVRVYLVYSSLGDTALLLMLLIRLLYMFTHTPMRMIMSPHMQLSLGCVNNAAKIIGCNRCLKKAKAIQSDMTCTLSITFRASLLLSVPLFSL